MANRACSSAEQAQLPPPSFVAALPSIFMHAPLVQVPPTEHVLPFALQVPLNVPLSTMPVHCAA
jgi:hypothetical protein